MNGTLVSDTDFASLRLRFVGSEVDRFGTNIHQLGRSLISSQEMINVTSSHKIRHDFPIDRYTATPNGIARHRVFFLQGHLGAAKKGSLDLIINLVSQPELRAFLQDENVRAFGISVLANLVTSASFILAGHWRQKRQDYQQNADPDTSLPLQLAPHLEKLSRAVTPKGGIGHIEMIAEDQKGCRVELRVDRHSRENILEFADSAPAKEIDIVGEVRSIDLDGQRLVVLHPATGERIEVEFYQDATRIESLLCQMVYIRGRIRPQVNRWGAVQTRVEVITIKTLSEMQRRP